MERKEKYINIIAKLVDQGFSKTKIDRYIRSLQKNYLCDDDIYECLKVFLDDESESDIKNPNIDLDTIIKMSENFHVYPTGGIGKYYSKNSPIYTGYMATNK